MVGSGVSALLLGRAFDARGFKVLFPAIIVAAVVAPLAFLGGSTVAVAGAVLWGIVLGVESSVLSAGVAQLVPESARARAYGTFSAVFGIAWFAGSVLLGALYDVSRPALAAVSFVAEIAANLPLILVVRTAKP